MPGRHVALPTLKSPAVQKKAEKPRRSAIEAFSCCESSGEIVAAFEEARAAKVCVQAATGPAESRPTRRGARPWRLSGTQRARAQLPVRQQCPAQSDLNLETTTNSGSGQDVGHAQRKSRGEGNPNAGLHQL